MEHFEEKQKHLRRFIILSVMISALIVLGHGVRLFFGWDFVVGGTTIPEYVSWLAVFIASSMIVMGLYYLKK